jgi:hypothetical protein
MTCLECGRRLRPARSRLADHPGTLLHVGRGLCSGCVYRVQRDGRLGDFPPLRGPESGFVEDVAVLVSSGADASTWPERLGSTPAAIARRLQRQGRHDLARPVESLISRERWAQRKGVAA